MKGKSLFFVFYCTLFFTLLSCSVKKHESGIKQIQKDTDTATLHHTIATIKSISNEVFEAGSFTGHDNIAINYRLLKPHQKNNDNPKLPLVIVFHGSGAIGTDNNKQLGVLPKLWALPEIREKYPAYVVAPQFPARSSHYVFDSSRGILVSLPQKFIDVSLQLIDSLKQVLNIDEHKIYAMGFSMGGSSVINALSIRPSMFAAGVSISGVPQFDSIQALANIPIWLLHGNLDTENPFSSDQQFFKEVHLKNKTFFWEFENTAHDDIITTIILGENIAKWLFHHKRF